MAKKSSNTYKMEVLLVHVELKPVKTKKIYEEIVDQIRQLLIEGHIKPGDKLPSERELIESFKVSRSSIREALSALEMMGILEVRTGEGTFIRHIRPESMMTSLAWSLYLDKGSILEMLEVRKMIEVQAVGYAAKRATEKEVNQLNETLDRMKNNIENMGSISEKADMMFHYTIAVATQNKITIRLMDTISDNLQHLIHATRPKLYEGKYTPELLYNEHEKIYNAIISRDSGEARKQMLEHLSGVENEILRDL